MSPLFIGDIYEPEQRRATYARAVALADKLNRVYATVVRQDNMTRYEVKSLASEGRLTPEDYDILGDRAYGFTFTMTRALHAPEYLYSLNL